MFNDQGDSHNQAGYRWGKAVTPGQLGDVLAALRAGDGLTQAQLAEAAGVPRRFVNEIEGGHATMYLTRLFAVLDALDCHVRLETRPPSQDDSGLVDLGW